METLQELFDAQIRDVPKVLLENMIRDKLKALNIKVPRGLPKRLAGHVWDQKRGKFRWNNAGADLDLKLTFTKADADRLEHEFEEFTKVTLPKLIGKVVDDTSRDMLETLRRNWKAEHESQAHAIAEFKLRLEERYGEALGLLRMLLTISREFASQLHVRKGRKQAAPQPRRDEVMLRLHARACQVTSEIVVLLENGFADGAMARWRTLHEIAIVAAVIWDHGEDIAGRYIEFQAVEAKRAKDEFMRCHKQLGHKAMSKRDMKDIDTAYDKALAIYGPAFKTPYGWAAHHLGKGKPNFADLEDAAGKAMMRAYYRMASYNVHANPKGVFFRLGALDESFGIIAGASNAGLIEPGQNAALTLAQISVLLCRNWTLDDLMAARVIMTLSQEIPQGFSRADAKLRRDDRKYRRDLVRAA